MNIKPIKTHEDYKAALSLVDELSDAQIGTEDFDKLDVVVTLIEAYEAKVYPIGPPDPIAAIEYGNGKAWIDSLRFGNSDWSKRARQRSAWQTASAVNINDSAIAFRLSDQTGHSNRKLSAK